MRATSAVVAVIVVAAATYLLLRRESPAPPPPSPPAASALAPGASEPPRPAAAPLPLPPPAAIVEPRAGYIAYPDGTWFPPLNGVQTAPQLHFHPKLAPFTKVVGREIDANGREWYVHENGVRSTTYVNSKGGVSYDIQLAATPSPMLPEELVGR
jgi:hypothetical protein